MALAQYATAHDAGAAERLVAFGWALNAQVRFHVVVLDGLLATRSLKERCRYRGGQVVSMKSGHRLPEEQEQPEAR
jgi:hypothetical protein